MPTKDQEERVVIETDFCELNDGTLLEVVEHPDRPGKRRLAVWNSGDTQFCESYERNGQTYVPPTSDGRILESIRLPRGAEAFKSVYDLQQRVESLIQKCVSIDTIPTMVLANFVLTTWIADRLPIAPYVAVVGLPQSGKTTLLRVLSLVCRRSLLVADISSADFYWACARFMPTFLIDETGTASNNRELRHMLRAGATRDVLAVRSGDRLHSFGPKVISWLEPPDDPALNSRCIQIPMFESTTNTLIGTDSCQIQEQAELLRAQLLRFRFENLKTASPAPVQGDERLRPRPRDLLRAITSVTGDEEWRSKIILNFFESEQVGTSEPLSPEHNAVLQVLFAIAHAGKEQVWSASISKMTWEVNKCLSACGERLRLKPRKLGAILTSLGFTDRKRTNSGWTLKLTGRDLKRVHQLVARYGLERFEGLVMDRSESECILCREIGLDESWPDPEHAAVTAKASFAIRKAR